MGNITEADRAQKDLKEKNLHTSFYFTLKTKTKQNKNLESTKTTTEQMPTLPHLKILSYFRQESKPLSHSPRAHCWLRLTLRGRCNGKKFQLYLQYYLRLEIFCLNQRWHICVKTCITQARETMLVISCQQREHYEVGKTCVCSTVQAWRAIRSQQG